MGRKPVDDPKKNAGISLRESEIERLKKLGDDMGASSLSQVVSSLIDFSVPDPVPFVGFAKRSDLPKLSGVYCLVEDGEILYVGKTRDLRKRWQSHHKSAVIKNASQAKIFYILAEESILSQIEVALIKYFAPPLNKTPGGDGRNAKADAPRRVQLRIPVQYLEVFDSYSADQLSELMTRALASMTPGVHLGDRLTSVIRPENVKAKTICRMSASDSQIKLLFPEKREDFRLIVKCLGYIWSNPFWVKRVEPKNVVDRCAEIAHRLLLGGFCVQVESGIVKDKAILAKYEPEFYRKVDAPQSEDWAGWFQVSWPKDEDFYDEARRLTASKYSEGCVYVPSEYFMEVADFAGIHDFWLTREAELLADAAEVQWNNLEIVNPKKRQRRAKTSPPNLSPDGIPDDLRDDG